MQIAKNKLKPSWIAAISAFIYGTLVHIFGLVNVLHNYDDISVQSTGYGSGVTSGRWLLTILGDWFTDWFGNHNLPVFNGIVFILLLAVSVAVLVEAFKIRNYCAAILCAMLFVTFPAATSVMFFKYTSIYYGIAILMSVAAVWVLPKAKFAGLLISGLLTALSLGIYQAYLPMTVAFFVLLLLQQTLKDDISFGKLLFRGMYACASIVIGLGLYFIFLNASLKYYGVDLSSYQGINTMGSVSLAKLPELIASAYKTFFELTGKDSYQLTQTILLKWGYKILFALDICMAVYCLIRRRKKFGAVIMTVFLLAVFPLAANLIVIMCPDGFVYTIMVYSFVALLWMPLVLLETIPHEQGLGRYVRGVLSKATAVVLAIVLLSYAYLTNVNYTSLYYTNRQVENYLNGIIVQTRMTEGFDANKKWAFIGDIKDPLIRGCWQNAPIYGGNTRTIDLLNAYSRNRWIYVYMGYTVPTANDEEIESLKESSMFAEMPCWPAEGSIKVINEFVVIKFSEQDTE